MSGAYGLTIKQEKFAEHYLKNRSPSKAYIAAGYKVEGWTDLMVAVEANKVLNNPKVSLKITAVQKAATKRSGYTLEQAINDALDDREMARGLGQLGAAVSACKLTAQLAGHLIERRDNTNRDVSETPDKELRAELARLQSERDKRADTVH